MKIGVIGAGNVGGTIGTLWHQAGHQVRFGAKHIEHARDLAQRLGPPASGGSVDEAIEQSEVVFLAIPLGAVPEIASAAAARLRGKIVIDADNPFVKRDGDVATEVIRGGRGTGIWTASKFPGARLVRGFNSVPMKVLETEAHRDGERIAIPLAGDDEQAVEIVARLVRDAGFEPIVAGGLEQAKEFDPGSPVFGHPHTASELKGMLHLR